MDNHHAVPSVPIYDLRQLNELTDSQLFEIFTQGTAEIPSALATERGRFVVCNRTDILMPNSLGPRPKGLENVVIPGGLQQLLNSFQRLWTGKLMYTDPVFRSTSLWNIVLNELATAVSGAVSIITPGLSGDKKPSMLINYQQSDFYPAHSLREEFRRVGPSIWLGRAFISDPTSAYLPAGDPGVTDPLTDLSDSLLKGINSAVKATAADPRLAAPDTYIPLSVYVALDCQSFAVPPIHYMPLRFNTEGGTTPSGTPNIPVYDLLQLTGGILTDPNQVPLPHPDTPEDASGVEPYILWPYNLGNTGVDGLPGLQGFAKVPAAPFKSIFGTSWAPNRPVAHGWDPRYPATEGLAPGVTSIAQHLAREEAEQHSIAPAAGNVPAPSLAQAPVVGTTEPPLVALLTSPSQGPAIGRGSVTPKAPPAGPVGSVPQYPGLGASNMNAGASDAGYQGPAAVGPVVPPVGLVPRDPGTEPALAQVAATPAALQAGGPTAATGSHMVPIATSQATGPIPATGSLPVPLANRQAVGSAAATGSLTVPIANSQATGLTAATGSLTVPIANTQATGLTAATGSLAAPIADSQATGLTAATGSLAAPIANSQAAGSAATTGSHTEPIADSQAAGLTAATGSLAAPIANSQAAGSAAVTGSLTVPIANSQATGQTAATGSLTVPIPSNQAAGLEAPLSRVPQEPSLTAAAAVGPPPIPGSLGVSRAGLDLRSLGISTGSMQPIPVEPTVPKQASEAGPLSETATSAPVLISPTFTGVAGAQGQGQELLPATKATPRTEASNPSSTTSSVAPTAVYPKFAGLANASTQLSSTKPTAPHGTSIPSSTTSSITSAVGNSEFTGLPDAQSTQQPSDKPAALPAAAAFLSGSTYIGLTPTRIDPRLTGEAGAATNTLSAESTATTGASSPSPTPAASTPLRLSPGSNAGSMNSRGWLVQAHGRPPP